MDVVIRALGASAKVDLQKLVLEDTEENFPLYPKNWGLSRPDKNIDHRRVPNLQDRFRWHGKSLEFTEEPASF